MVVPACRNAALVHAGGGSAAMGAGNDVEPLVSVGSWVVATLGSGIGELFVGDGCKGAAHFQKGVGGQLGALGKREVGSVAGEDDSEAIYGEAVGNRVGVDAVVLIPGNVELADGDVGVPVAAIVAWGRFVDDGVIGGAVGVEVGCAPVAEDLFA